MMSELPYGTFLHDVPRHGQLTVELRHRGHGRRQRVEHEQQ